MLSPKLKKLPKDILRNQPENTLQTGEAIFSIIHLLLSSFSLSNSELMFKEPI
jgi:hypothetical protein